MTMVRRIHGDGHNTNSPYHSWASIKCRCYNTSYRDYKYYGGKGVKLCDEWKDYLVFKEWSLTHGWKKGYVLDRLDPNKDYCPTNCEWVTKTENTRRSNALHTSQKCC